MRICTDGPLLWSCTGASLRGLVTVSAIALAVGCNGKADDSGGDIDTVDTTAPVITLSGDNPLSVAFGGTFTDPGATVTDDVDTGLSATVTGTVDTGTLGEYALSYDATDSAGNAAATVTRTVVVADLTAPVITLNGDNPLLLVEGNTFTDPGATVTDDVDTGLSATVTGTVDTSTAGTYTLTYDATDSAGNVAASVQRIVDVVYSGPLFAVAAGSDLVLVGMTPDGTLKERAVASLDPEIVGYNTNHVIFGIAQDPTSSTLYVTSFNECGAIPLDTDGCWGNARIDRFTYDVNSITHEGLAFLAQPSLRVLPPDFDAGTGDVTLTVLNQGGGPLDITTVSEDDLPSDVALVSGCEGVILAEGDTCEVVFETTSGVTSSAYFSFETDAGVFTFYVYYDATLDLHRVVPDDSSSETKSTTLPECALEVWGTADQYGACAPTALAISADGSRVYVNEDDYDVGLVLALNSDGTMTFLSESDDNVSLQGIAVNTTNTAVYNGSSAYSISSDVLTQDYSGSGGNATEVASFGGDELLLTTIRNRTFDIYSLVDPLSPALVTSLTPTSGGARFQHHSADGSLFAVVDLNSILTASFDGTTLTELDNVSIDIDVGTCKNCSYDAYTRAVQVTPDGGFAVSSAFVNTYDLETWSTIAFKGAITSYRIEATTGVLSEVSTMTFPGMSRALLLLRPPE